MTNTFEQNLSIEDVTSMAIEVFGNESVATKWLNSENRALDNRKPVDLINTFDGRELVKIVLGRLQYGAYS